MNHLSDTDLLARLWCSIPKKDTPTSSSTDPLRLLIEEDLELQTRNISGGGVFLKGMPLRDLDEVEEIHGRDTRKRIEAFHAKCADLMPLEKYANRWQPDNDHPWANKTFCECIEEELGGGVAFAHDVSGESRDESGKWTKGKLNTRQLVAKEIEKLFKELSGKANTPKDLNEGECENGDCHVFADRLVERLHELGIKNVKNMTSGHHSWIKVDNHYYDVESPEGVDSYFELEYFKRHGKEYAELYDDMDEDAMLSHNPSLFSHDVSEEKRDESGKWTKSGDSGKKNEGGTSDSAVSSVEKGIQGLNKLPAIHTNNQTGEVIVTKPVFPQATNDEAEDIVDWNVVGSFPERRQLTSVPLNQLISIEDKLFAVMVKFYMEHLPDKDGRVPIGLQLPDKSIQRVNEPPVVAKYKGKLWIINGHHRLSALKLMGFDNAKVDLYDADAAIAARQTSLSIENIEGLHPNDIDEVARNYIETAVASDLATESHTCNGLNGIKNVLMDNDKYMQVYHVVGGIGQVPDALYDKINARILTSVRVTSVTKSKNGYQVSGLMIGEKTLKEKSSEFDAVIVALPNHWLRTINWEGKLAEAIHNTCAHYDLPAHYLRVSMLFDKKWWAKLNMPGEFWMMDMFNGCCCYDESTRWSQSNKVAFAHDVTGEKRDEGGKWTNNTSKVTKDTPKKEVVEIFNSIGDDLQPNSSYSQQVRIFGFSEEREITISMGQFKDDDTDEHRGWKIRVDFGIRGKQSDYTGSEVQEGTMEMVHFLKKAVKKYHTNGFHIAFGAATDKRSKVYGRILKQLGMEPIGEHRGEEIWLSTNDIPEETSGHVLSFLLAGGDALLLCSSNQDDECIIEYVLQSLPPIMRQDAEDHFVEGQVNRFVGSINAQPGGWPAEELRGEHTPEPTEHPGVFLCGDYFFDSTLNAALMSANTAVELLVEYLGVKSAEVTEAVEALELEDNEV